MYVIRAELRIMPEGNVPNYVEIDWGTYVSNKPVDGPVLDSLVASCTGCCVDTGFGIDSLCTLARTGTRSARNIRPLKSPKRLHLF